MGSCSRPPSTSPPSVPSSSAVNAPSTRMNAIRAVAADRFSQRWLVPRCTDDVAGPQRGLAVIQHEHDLALEHDPVVHGLGAVHGGDDAGRELVDPDLGAVRCRRHGQRGQRRVGLGRRDRGGHRAGGPDLAEQRPVRRGADHGDRAVGGEDGDAALVMSGHDAAGNGRLVWANREDGHTETPGPLSMELIRAPSQHSRISRVTPERITAPNARYPQARACLPVRTCASSCGTEVPGSRKPPLNLRTPQGSWHISAGQSWARAIGERDVRHSRLIFPHSAPCS